MGRQERPGHGRRRPRLAAIGLSACLAVFPSLAGVPARGAGGATTGAAATDSDGDGLSDRWEQRLGLNPLKKDSDGDGVPDGREDHDHDHLTNQFEIGWSVTDPRTNDTDGDGVRDTSGNGISDGAEDANHNGLTNAAEQDARHVPNHLVPSLAGAALDMPVTYLDGCHVKRSEAYRRCLFGDPGGSVHVALFGDSHAAQWFPALLAAAKTRHWRIDYYTRSGCPSADVRTFRGGHLDTQCLDYRPRALADMAADVPTIVILSSLRIYPLHDQNGAVVPASNREAVWDAGLARTLNALPAGSRAVVLADTPLPAPVTVPICLEQHLDSIAACEGSRSAWINALHDSGERTTAVSNGAVFRSLNRQVCPYDPCGAVYDELLVYRDISHLSTAFSRSLAPSMGAMLDGVLAP